MKRYVLLLFSLVILALAVSSTNAAFNRQVALAPDSVLGASPTPTPTSVPTATPTATPKPTATPTPAAWTGEYEVIIETQGAWRTGTSNNFLGNRTSITIVNHTNTSIKDWRLSFSVNADIQLIDTWPMTKVTSKDYQFRRPDQWNMEIPAYGRINNSATVATYALSYVMEDGRLTRTTNPDFRQLLFYNGGLQIATDKYGGTLRSLNANQVKITYKAPTGYDSEIMKWLNGLYTPATWTPVH